MAFSVKQLRFMDYVEQIFMLEGQPPSWERMVKAVPGISKADYDGYFRTSSIIKELNDVRGVTLQMDQAGALTPEQLVTANTLLNLADKRSEKNKLKDLGVSATKFAAWKKDAAFNYYCRTRAQQIVGDTTNVDLALADVAARGDVSAIKLVYEMTGRWSSKTVGELNVEFLMGKIIQILEVNITDPQLLGRISDDLLSLIAPAGNGSANPNASVISGGVLVGSKPPVAGVTNTNTIEGFTL